MSKRPRTRRALTGADMIVDDMAGADWDEAGADRDDDDDDEVSGDDDGVARNRHGYAKDGFVVDTSSSDESSGSGTHG